jgi:hypothetical protein
MKEKKKTSLLVKNKNYRYLWSSWGTGLTKWL